MPGPFLHPFAKPTRESFIPIVRGEGALVWDSSGNEYVDGMASLWYCAIGHGRREMADAVAAQIMMLEAYSTFDPFTNEPAEQLAAELVRNAPMPDARVFFCCSGSEAIDTAMKLARLSHAMRGEPQRQLIISRARGYHGTNYGGTSAQGIGLNKEGWGALLPEVVQVPSDDLEAIASLMAQRGNEVAAIISEPVQGAGGVFPPEDGYLEGLRRLCDQHGALLIFDEVICGFGRLGRWFGSDHYGVTPDLTTFAKAVTSGYQTLGGVFVGRKVRDGIESDPNYLMRTGFTYSGHPTACAAGLKNLEILQREQLFERSLVIGKRLESGLQSIAADGLVASVRGAGAVWAVGHHPDRDAFAVRDRMLGLGVITRAVGTDTNTFCPPFVTTDAQVDRIVDALATALR